jgi:hypothetical protein
MRLMIPYERRFVASRWGLNGGPWAQEWACGRMIERPSSRVPAFERSIRFEPFPGSKGSAWGVA